MLKTYQFKTQCKGDIHSSKTANIILPGLVTEYRFFCLHLSITYVIDGDKLNTGDTAHVGGPKIERGRGVADLLETSYYPHVLTHKTSSL